MTLKEPTTLAQAKAQIKHLSTENEAMSDALHKMSNECAVVLSNKDMEMRDKCSKCTRGRQ